MAKRIDENEEGGFVKNPSRRPRRREDDENRPTARKREQAVEGGLAGLADPEVQKRILGKKRPVKTTPPPPATRIVKKEEKVIQNNTPQTPRTFTTIQDTESCPVCGYRKPKEITVRTRDVRPLVCKGCSDRYHQYGSEVATRLAKGETVAVLTRHAWVLAQLDLARFEQELKAAEAEKNRLNEEVQKKLAAHGRLPREVFLPLRDRLQEETGARRAYGNWRRLEERLKAALVVRPEVEKMVADEASQKFHPDHHRSVAGDQDQTEKE